MNKTRGRILLFLLLVAVSAGIILWMNSRGMSLERLFDRRDSLMTIIKKNALFASFIFVLVYMLVVAFSVPGATALSLLGGFFFGPYLGTALVNVGATSGALLVFLAARYLLRDGLMEKYRVQLEKLNAELKKNGANYLLTLRFIPLFPFFLVNLLSGLTQVSWFTYVWTTAVGIIPGSFVYTLLGSSGATLDSAGSVLSPRLIGGLVLLGVVSLIPVVFRKQGERKKKK